MGPKLNLTEKLSSNSNMDGVIVLQVMLDEEQEAMESATRVAEPRNTDSFDYSNYHTINEVSTHAHSGYCYPVKALLPQVNF